MEKKRKSKKLVNAYIIHCTYDDELLCTISWLYSRMKISQKRCVLVPPRKIFNVDPPKFDLEPHSETNVATDTTDNFTE